MGVMTAIRNRRSIRKYSSRPVEQEKLQKVLEAAQLAPSAGNKQNWKFVVARDEEARSKIADSTGLYQFIGQAPVIIAACGTDPDSIMKCGQHRYTVDLSIATSFILLAAWEQGLGTCWIGRFDEGIVKEALGIPEGVRVVAITPLGYPDEAPAQRPRKKLEEIVCYDKWE